MALVSLVFSSLHYAYEKICARATLLDKKINFFYVFSIARTRKVLRKNICFKWAKTSVQIGMNECLVSINMFISRPVTRGGARGALAPSPTGPKGPHFDTQYPGVQSVKLKFQT